MELKQDEMFRNWYGYEVTEDEFLLCRAAHEWSVDWDLPIPDGIEEAYEKSTGNSCMYWEDGLCTAMVGNPNREDLPRAENYVTNGYTEGFYSWLEKRIFEAVRSGLKDVRDIWNAVKAI